MQSKVQVLSSVLSLLTLHHHPFGRHLLKVCIRRIHVVMLNYSCLQEQGFTVILVIFATLKLKV